MASSTKKIYVLLFAGWLLSALFVFQIAISSFQQYNLLRSVQSHGARSEATIISYFKSNCTKHGCATNVNYKFTLDGNAPGTVFYGHGIIGDDWNPQDAQFNLARHSGAVPIAYDTLNPNISAINFRDYLFRMPANSYLKTIIIDNAMPFLIFPALILAAWGKDIVGKYKGRSRA